MKIAIDKNALLEKLRKLLEADLQVITASQHEMQAGATHAEAKPECKKDMRSTEASYLARGLAQRVLELRTDVAQLGALVNRHFDEAAVVALTAVVLVEDEAGEELTYYVAPCGGGMVVAIDGHSVLVVTPTSPVGAALLGRAVDEEITLELPQVRKSLTIVEMA